MTPRWLEQTSLPQMDWTEVEADFPFRAPMQDCVQDPVHHAEGDVWTHTRMVADALSSFGFDDQVAKLTALFHDVEKPSTRVVQDGHVRHPKHAPYGAHTAWKCLWKAQVSLDVRLAVYGLILWHQRVFHLWTYDDMQRKVQEFAAVGDWPSLINFARADNAGRICADPKLAEDNLVLLREWVEENYVEQDAASRLAYFETEGRSAQYGAHPPEGSRVTIMCGAPGSGKDYHVRHEHPDIPVISLDAIRGELGVDWEDDQAPVVHLARERMRALLRKREPFVYNATCINRLMRRKVIGECRGYDAYVTIDALDVPYRTILMQNRNRERVVPEFVIDRFIERYEPPSLLEAHEVRWFERV